MIPPSGKEFKTTFDYKDKFRANFVATEPLELNGNSIIEDKMQIIVAAKRVDVIDGYAESLNCLLYTSPSPRDATLSRMPSSA